MLPRGKNGVAAEGKWVWLRVQHEGILRGMEILCVLAVSHQYHGCGFFVFLS